MLKASLDRNRCLESLKAFLPDDKEIESVINMCDLNPVDKSWRKWTDWQGNYIYIKENKKIKLSNDPELKKYNTLSDLYFKSPPNKISSISKQGIIHVQDNSCKIWLVGRDNKLRIIYFNHDAWQENILPLSCGVDEIRKSLKLLSKQKFTKLKKNQWIVFDWPPVEDVKEEILILNENIGMGICGLW